MRAVRTDEKGTYTVPSCTVDTMENSSEAKMSLSVKVSKVLKLWNGVTSERYVAQTGDCYFWIQRTFLHRIASCFTWKSNILTLVPGFGTFGVNFLVFSKWGPKNQRYVQSEASIVFLGPFCPNKPKLIRIGRKLAELLKIPKLPAKRGFRNFKTP